MSETQGSTLQSATATSISEHLHWLVGAGGNGMMGRGSCKEKENKRFLDGEKGDIVRCLFLGAFALRDGFVVRTMAVQACSLPVR